MHILRKKKYRLLFKINNESCIPYSSFCNCFGTLDYINFVLEYHYEHLASYILKQFQLTIFFNVQIVTTWPVETPFS